MSWSARLQVAALAGAVALVLADSSIVVLALPEIFRQFETSINGVSWVLVSFNLTLAVVAVPAARWARHRHPGRVVGLGLVISGLATLACGLSTDLPSLIAARAVQGVGGACAILAALALLSDTLEGEHRAVPIWVGAGVVAAALGPAIGGFLTEFVSWQSIFLFQVPLYAAVTVALLGTIFAARPLAREGSTEDAQAREHPQPAANLALALTSAGIAATLFLVVIMLIEGWGLSPLAAAAVVTTVPLATLLGLGLVSRIPDQRHRALAGTILLAGGLAGLGLLPKALVVLTLPPQALAGVGLALILSSLTQAAMEGRKSGVVQAGWTISSRHAGVVVGIVLLTPIFTASLDRESDRAIDAGTAILLDSDLATSTKLELAERLPAEVTRQGQRRVPRIEGAFDPLPGDPEERAGVIELRAGLTDQLDRAVTSAFSTAFLLAALVALLALFPIHAIARSSR